MPNGVGRTGAHRIDSRQRAARNERDERFVGFKYMIGHNTQILYRLSEFPDIKIVYVLRENKLAQSVSLLKALQSKRWAHTQKDDYVEKNQAGPLNVSHRLHEYATYDELFPLWLETQPHEHMTVEYRQILESGFEEKICAFLGCNFDPSMKSTLVKQRSNEILDRFEKPGRIPRYFNLTELERWLGQEIG
ncbi:Stf0 family sulfotransferase [Aliiroseovarius sp. KMU-50]|uniref:Stf0 family sulfotransferase n=1 Tax=Aliiroseovarius salicola TaxID=3009082 RepID=A0ABT4W4D8_9RHOB|nr:Stf0 family sulfotransferase [Aliiroseovarius sp. KMU-50]MDA5095384.1 Stf0 family sulfotransferase [Aliiroseovarius sp. KMU-50]